MAWGGGRAFSFTSLYRFLSSSVATELKLDLSRVDQIISANNGKLIGYSTFMCTRSLVHHSFILARLVSVQRSHVRSDCGTLERLCCWRQRCDKDLENVERKCVQWALIGVFSNARARVALLPRTVMCN